MQPHFRHLAIGLALCLGPLTFQPYAALAADQNKADAQQPDAGKHRVVASTAETTNTTTKATNTTRIVKTRRPAKIVARAPIRLTPPQSRPVYRTVVEQPTVVPQVVVAPPVAEVATTEPDEIVTTAPPAIVTTAPPTYVVVPAPPEYVTTERVVTTPVPRAPATVAYGVGAPLPQTVPVYDMPPTVATRVPSVRGYRYAMIGNRVLVVDPASNVVVAELYQ